MVLNDYLRGLVADERKLSSLFEWAQMLQHMEKDPIDLSIGNPNMGPPRDYYQALEELITESQAARSNMHGYVPNRGLRGTREGITAYLTSFLRTDFEGDEPILYIPGYAFGGERYNDYVPLLRQEAGGAALYSEPIISSRKMSASESRFPPCRRPGEREKGLDPGWRKAAVLSWHSGPGGGGSKPVGE